jgi:hypothetical protein
MSVPDTKRTCHDVGYESAFSGKADVRRTWWNVAYWHFCDIAQHQT